MPVVLASPPRLQATRGRHTVLHGHAVPLPSELVIAILEWLAPDELWGPAHVSRQFYRAAWAAGLIIHRTLVFSPHSRYPRQLDLFAHISAHAQQKALSLSLSLRCRHFIEVDSDRCPGLYDGFIPALNLTMPVVTAALPAIVHLTVAIPDQLLPRLYSDFCRHPAPLLRTLAIERIGRQGPCDIPLPYGLFTGRAPLLRSLSLVTAKLPDNPVPAFGAVSRAKLVFAPAFPTVAFKRHFPQLTSLVLECDAQFCQESRIRSRLDLGGVTLHKLVVRDEFSAGLLESVARSVDLSTIAHLRFNGIIARSACAVMSLRTPFAMRLSSSESWGGGITATATATQRCWQRLIVDTSYYAATASLGLAKVPSVGTHMAYMRLDAELISDFLALCLTLSALRDLHIDVEFGPLTLDLPDYRTYPAIESFLSAQSIPDSTNSPRVWAPCPALCTIRIFALREPIVDADSRSVAFLAHALGQLERPEGERTTLVLVGLSFAAPVAHELLSQVVSTTHLRAFSGRGSREDDDGGLWEHQVSDLDML